MERAFPDDLLRPRKKQIQSYEKFIEIRNDKQMTIQEAGTYEYSETVSGCSGSPSPVSNGTYGDAKNA
jgi:hypothetical protein